MTKYQKYFQDMLRHNQTLFDSFQEIHDKFTKDPDKWKGQFNEVGQEVLDVVRRYENRLCSQTEGSGFGKFSSNLADKFQAEVKSHFPKINSVGLE